MGWAVMGMIDPRQLGQLQTFAQKPFDQTNIKIQKLTRTKDAYGAYSETWATTATVNGNYDKPSPQIMEEYAGLIGSLAAWIVRLPISTTVSNNDRLVIGSDTLTVQTVLSTRSYASVVMLLATEIR